MTRAEWRAAAAARQNIVISLMDAATEYDDDLECEVFTPRQLSREVDEFLKTCREDEDLCLILPLVKDVMAQFLRELMQRVMFRRDCSPVITTDELLTVHAELTLKDLGGIEDDGCKNDTSDTQPQTL